MSTAERVAELIQRCRKGENEACEELFERYRSYLTVLAHAQLGRQLQAKCDASDLVQQTLLEAFRDFSAFQGEVEPELLGWLRRILAHNLYNEARRYNTQQRNTARELSLEQMAKGVEQSSLFLNRCLEANTPTPSKIASNREDVARLADMLSELPEDYQTVLIFRVFEGLPAEEVAERMQRTAGAVRMLQMRALAALKEKMEQPS